MKREPCPAGGNDYSGQGDKDETRKERFARARQELRLALQPYVYLEPSKQY